jgi:hypothetical protein
MSAAPVQMHAAPALAPNVGEIDLSLADLELSRLDRDYLATIDATVFDQEPLDDPADEGYQVLGDGDASESGDENGDAAEHVNDDGGPMVGAKKEDALAVPDDGLERVTLAQATAPAPADEVIVDRPRDITLTDDTRALVTNLMSGFALPGADAWADRKRREK